ncbi:DUF6232 family protein [Streptomyces mutabilis]|uniref:DUF6232 family protein n=1 Tax=Streptomyces mutabilis TaxID=67332 RepID=UPI001785C5C6|nr:DUF6232 family protein [Streptomyces mutabilis]
MESAPHQEFQPPGQRTQPPGQYDIPPPPAVPPRTVRAVDLRVGKRLLWVGAAAYPLQNITRVYTFTMMPRRKEATLRFLKRTALILSVAFALTIVAGLTAIADSSMAGGILTFVWIGAVAALVFSIVDLFSVLSAPAQYVLAVETSGPSIAMVTSSDPHQLDRLVAPIVQAIENPEAEFHVEVEQLLVNPSNYYFGDNVNMYGGSGNVGMGKS